MHVREGEPSSEGEQRRFYRLPRGLGRSISLLWNVRERQADTVSDGPDLHKQHWKRPIGALTCTAGGGEGELARRAADIATACSAPGLRTARRQPGRFDSAADVYSINAGEPLRFWR